MTKIAIRSVAAALALIGQAMAAGMRAAAGEEIVRISAGNYGGKLGKFHFPLHELLAKFA